MDPIAAKYIAAGLACIGMGGAAIALASGSSLQDLGVSGEFSPVERTANYLNNPSGNRLSPGTLSTTSHQKTCRKTRVTKRRSLR